MEELPLGTIQYTTVRNSHFNCSSLLCPLELTPVTAVTSSPQWFHVVVISNSCAVFPFTQQFSLTQAPVSFMSQAFKNLSVLAYSHLWTDLDSAWSAFLHQQFSFTIWLRKGLSILVWHSDRSQNLIPPPLAHPSPSADPSCLSGSSAPSLSHSSWTQSSLK